MTNLDRRGKLLVLVLVGVFLGLFRIFLSYAIHPLFYIFGLGVSPILIGIGLYQLYPNYRLRSVALTVLLAVASIVIGESLWESSPWSGFR